MNEDDGGSGLGAFFRKVEIQQEFVLAAVAVFETEDFLDVVGRGDIYGVDQLDLAEQYGELDGLFVRETGRNIFPIFARRAVFSVFTLRAKHGR